MRLWLLLLSLLPLYIDAVNRADFKTCEQSSFCKRHRALEPGQPKYVVLPETVKLDGSVLSAHLRQKENGRLLSLRLTSLHDSTLRLSLDEVEGLRPRFRADDALTGPPKEAKFKSHTPGAASSMLMTLDGHKVILHYAPFRLDVYRGSGDLVLSLNSAGLLKYEHFREKKETPPPSGDEKKEGEEGAEEGEKEAEAGDEAKPEEENKDGGGGNSSEEGEGFWEEHFKSHRDSKPHGSSSVGMDIAFVGFGHVYGLPEHADAFALRSTKDTDPYRLYNLDVFEYELNNPMALYGSVPYAIGHSASGTIGVLWLNPSETWVDVRPSTADQGMLRSLVERMKPSGTVPQVDTHWISEAGLIDVFVLIGPAPSDVFRQYAALTGVSELPPAFALAYHQCRWNYNDMEDVAGVNANFDVHDIPMDVIWLDIEHTDGKRYFTWEPSKFSDPKAMIDNVAASGRKMVTIIDPHIKKDDGYSVYKDALDQDFFVKDRDGKDLDGWCWPGSSAYLDFMDPRVRDYWASRFAFDKYQGSTADLYVWNDMNEPSVFNGPEVTMHKDCKHHGGWEHRDIHNMYGFYHHASTVKGLKDRSGGAKRPFVLTRAFFAGSQRYSAVWTGDNMAKWDHLQISIPMLLSLSVAGIPFVGADVGGFFHNPDEELLARWYQMGAYSPFFRAHAHIDARRREPWLFSEETKTVIRDAIRARYRLLPFWYSLFREHAQSGQPIMRPLWAHFPEDEHTFDEDREFLLGDALLVRPVTEAGATSASVYLPGKETLWYDLETRLGRPGPGALYVEAPLGRIPVFQRGGTIVPSRERIRRASTLMAKDPITLTVALNFHGDAANGTLYLDEGDGYEYEKGAFLHRLFELTASNQMEFSIASSNLDPSGTLQSPVTIERINVLGLKFRPSRVHLLYEDYKAQDLAFKFDEASRTLVIRKPDVLVSKDWRIDVHAH